MKKVLIIEDDPVLNSAYKQKLESLYQLVMTSEGEMGISLAVSEVPDLIVLDLILPGLENGLHILRKLKENPATSPIPVIVITNIDNQSKPAFDSGAVDYLIKSNIDMNEVVKKINAYLPAV